VTSFPSCLPLPEGCPLAESTVALKAVSWILPAAVGQSATCVALVLGSPALRQVGSNLARPWVNLPPRDISPIRSALIVSQSILGLGSGLAPSRKGASLGSAHPHLAAEEVAAVIPGGSVGLDRIIPPCPARWRASHIPAGPACLPTHGPAEMQEIL